MKKSMILGGAAALVAAGVAGADYTIDFADFAAAGGDFTLVAAGADVSGVLTGVTASFSQTDAAGAAWASDLAVLVGDVKVGGDFTSFGETFEYAYTTGRTANGTVDEMLATLDDVHDVTGQDIFLGNGWVDGAGDSFGIWTGSITLHGITVVPAPGAIALLGLGGLVARRRRG